MDLETAQQLASLQEAMVAFGERVVALNNSVKAMVEMFARDEQFRQEYAEALDAHKTASQTESDAAAIEQMLAKIRAMQPKTGQA